MIDQNRVAVAADVHEEELGFDENHLEGPDHETHQARVRRCPVALSSCLCCGVCGVSECPTHAFDR